MANNPLPCPTMLRLLLQYDPETGGLRWRVRPVWMFRDSGHGMAANARAWNARFAGTDALTGYVAGYVAGQIKRRTVRAHRAAWAVMFGYWPPEDIDHINGNRADNRISNLRSVSRAENGRNQCVRNTNTSGVLGVHWHKKAGKWAAEVTFNGKSRHLGLFDNLDDAAEARRRAEAGLGFHPNHGRPTPKQSPDRRQDIR